MAEDALLVVEQFRPLLQLIAVLLAALVGLAGVVYTQGRQTKRENSRLHLERLEHDRAIAGKAFASFDRYVKDIFLLVDKDGEILNLVEVMAGLEQAAEDLSAMGRLSTIHGTDDRLQGVMEGPDGIRLLRKMLVERDRLVRRVVATARRTGEPVGLQPGRYLLEELQEALIEMLKGSEARMNARLAAGEAELNAKKAELETLRAKRGPLEARVQTLETVRADYERRLESEEQRGDQT